MTKPAVFTQGDISKLLKGAAAAGMTVTRVEIDRTGKIVAQIGKADDDQPKEEETDLDRIIRAQKEQFAAKRDGVSRPAQKLARSV